MSLISVKDNLGIPKYKQIIASVENALIDGTLKKGDKLPSINSIKNKFSLSRDTVLKAFNELKLRGILQSIAGKGYYIKSENVSVSQKIFLLFDELNSFKEDLYNSFLKTLNPDIQVDIYFHHFNLNVFNKLILDNKGTYNYYIIMPANFKNTNKVIQHLPKDKVYILDQVYKDISHYAAIYQNFENGIYNNLKNILHLINKYDKLIFLYQEEKQPKGMLRGFQRIVKNNNINSEVLKSLSKKTPRKGEIYLSPNDKNLILIIKKIKEENLKIGVDIGIISYNDTLLKEIVEGGITTISTNFNKMGEKLAQMIMNKENTCIENPTVLIVRNSL